MKIEMTTEMVNNLFTFLDRIEIKGLKEVHALNQILDSVYKANKEDDEDK